MRLFILTESKFDIPALVIFQKVADIINAGKHSTQLHFYIVGECIPQHFHDEYAAHPSNITVLSTKEAQHLLRQVTNAMVIHFGLSLKGSHSFPQYFIPLTYPNIDHTLPLFSRWIQQYKFKNFIKNATSVYCINHWAELAFEKKYEKYFSKFQNAILPSSTPPTFDWLVLSETKSALSQGSNYFLCFIHPENFVATLKEFSQFKKWQQTTMAMVFVFDSYKQCSIADDLLKGYKYKDSIYIKCIHALKMEWIAASYAIFWGNINFNKSYWMQWAIHYDVPQLIDQKNLIPESWLRAGEVFSFAMTNALSDHFKLYYRDEVYRQARANMGTEWLSNLEMVAPPHTSVKIPLDLKP
jgi:hypothetical protein